MRVVKKESQCRTAEQDFYGKNQRSGIISQPLLLGCQSCLLLKLRRSLNGQMPKKIQQPHLTACWNLSKTARKRRVPDSYELYEDGQLLGLLNHFGVTTLNIYDCTVQGNGDRTRHTNTKKSSIYKVSLKSPEDYYLEENDLCLRADLMREAVRYESVATLCYMLTFSPCELWTPGKLTLGGKGKGIEACASALRELEKLGFVCSANVSPTFGWVYLIEAIVDGVHRHKIGESLDPYSRFNDIQSHSPVKLTLKHLIQSNARKDLETSLHKKYGEARIQLGLQKGEWFELTASQVQEILSLGGDR